MSLLTAGYTYHGLDNSESKSLYHMCTSRSNVTAGYVCEPKRILDMCQPLFEKFGHWEQRVTDDEDGCLYPVTRGAWSDLTTYEKLVASRLRNEAGNLYTQELWDAGALADPRPNSKSWSALSVEERFLWGELGWHECNWDGEAPEIEGLTATGDNPSLEFYIAADRIYLIDTHDRWWWQVPDGRTGGAFRYTSSEGEDVPYTEHSMHAVRAYENTIMRGYNVPGEMLNRAMVNSSSGFYNFNPLFTLHNLQASEEECVRPVELQSPFHGAKMKPTAIVQVNDKDDPYEMRKLISGYVLEECPSFENFIPKSFGRRKNFEDLLVEDRLSWLNLHSSQIMQNKQNNVAQNNVLEPDNIDAFIKKFDEGELMGIFYKSEIKCSADVCSVSETQDRTYWDDLDETQQALATSVGYEQSSWDHPDAKFKPLPFALKISLQNYLEPP